MANQLLSPTDPHFPDADLGQSSEYDFLEKIGEGSYGSVWKAIEKATGRTVAIKVLPQEADMDPIDKEIKMLSSLSACDFVVQYFDSFSVENDFYIVMEYCEAGSVADMMETCEITLTESQIASILADTLLALAYLHDKKWIHRDIKAGNILLDSKGRSKLADFGVSAQYSNSVSKRKTVVGTPLWMAPEVIQEVEYDGKADIWSLGITAIEMADGCPPLADVHPYRAIFMIPQKPPPTVKSPESWSPPFLDFLKCCLQKDPKHRQTAIQLQEHPFIQSSNGCAVVRELVLDCIDVVLERRKERTQLAKMHQTALAEFFGPSEFMPAGLEGTGTWGSTRSFVSKRSASSSGTLNVKGSSCDGEGTMVFKGGDAGTVVFRGGEDGTVRFLCRGDPGTMAVGEADSGTVVFKGSQGNGSETVVFKGGMADAVGGFDDDGSGTVVFKPGTLERSVVSVEEDGKLVSMGRDGRRTMIFKTSDFDREGTVEFEDDDGTRGSGVVVFEEETAEWFFHKPQRRSGREMDATDLLRPPALSSKDVPQVEKSHHQLPPTHTPSQSRVPNFVDQGGLLESWDGSQATQVLRFDHDHPTTSATSLADLPPVATTAWHGPSATSDADSSAEKAELEAAIRKLEEERDAQLAEISSKYAAKIEALKRNMK